ncbi:MAG: RNA polymerase sigma factor [Sedimentisphaerales bacterium]|nr:RNA polymerase sigma factor [Sedimentisphaerales bacterium]
MAGGKEQKVISDGPGSLYGELRVLSVEELARRSQQGCRASFAELADRYGERLLRFLRRRTNSLHDAEDLVQDTFVRAFANIDRYRNTYKFSTWLYTIARHLASSRLRRLRNSDPVLETRSCEPAPGDKAVRRETRHCLWQTAETLSPNQYQALWLRYAETMSIKEIARVMGKSQVSVKVTLFRARTHMAEKLREITANALGDENVSPEETLAFMKVEGA